MPAPISSFLLHPLACDLQPLANKTVICTVCTSFISFQKLSIQNLYARNAKSVRTRGATSCLSFCLSSLISKIEDPDTTCVHMTHMTCFQSRKCRVDCATGCEISVGPVTVYNPASIRVFSDTLNLLTWQSQLHVACHFIFKLYVI